MKHKILILSGKGGVGKSTVTSLLAHALAKMNPDINVSFGSNFNQLFNAITGLGICDLTLHISRDFVVETTCNFK